MTTVKLIDCFYIKEIKKVYETMEKYPEPCEIRMTRWLTDCLAPKSTGKKKEYCLKNMTCEKYIKHNKGQLIYRKRVSPSKC